MNDLRSFKKKGSESVGSEKRNSSNLDARQKTKNTLKEDQIHASIAIQDQKAVNDQTSNNEKTA